MTFTSTTSLHRPATHSKGLRSLFVIDVPPGKQLDRVRQPHKGVSGKIWHLRESFMRALNPGMELLSHIRGARVAIDYLTDAFLRHSEVADIVFGIPENKRGDFERWADTYRKINGTGPFAIHPIHSLTQGLDALGIDLWFNLHGDIHQTLKLRNLLSQQVFPTITLQHGISTHTLFYERFFRAMLTPHYSCDSFICTSRASQKALITLLDLLSSSFNEEMGTSIRFRGRVDLLPLCVDTDHLTPQDKLKCKKAIGIPQGAILLLSLGYLAPVKADITVTLSIFAKLIRENPAIDLRFIIAGTGPNAYRDALNDAIKDLDLHRRVTVLADVSDIDKEMLFSSADIFVALSESLQESFGLTLIEAMAFGVPQVASDWNGYRDTVVDGYTGFLVPTTWGRFDEAVQCTGDMLGWSYDHILQGQSVAVDLDRLYECLRLLIINPDLRASMSKRSRERVLSLFSYRPVVKEYEALCLELSAIAKALTRDPAVRSFDLPLYYKAFKHYASRTVTGTNIVKIRNDECASYKQALHAISKELDGIKIVDSLLLDEIFQTLTAANASIGLAVKDIVTDLPKWSQETIERHVMFLVKHGLATIS